MTHYPLLTQLFQKNIASYAKIEAADNGGHARRLTEQLLERARELRIVGTAKVATDGGSVPLSVEIERRHGFIYAASVEASTVDGLMSSS